MLKICNNKTNKKNTHNANNWPCFLLESEVVVLLAVVFKIRGWKTPVPPDSLTKPPLPKPLVPWNGKWRFCTRFCWLRSILALRLPTPYKINDGNFNFILLKKKTITTTLNSLKHSFIKKLNWKKSKTSLSQKKSGFFFSPVVEAVPWAGCVRERRNRFGSRWGSDNNSPAPVARDHTEPLVRTAARYKKIK